MSDPILRITVEIISAAICIILLKFMIKPYTVTREARYIGLPLGFGFLGASYAISAIAYAQPNFYDSEINNIKWIQLLFRAFSFVFLAVAYYFSKKPSKNTRYAWDIALSGLFVSLLTLLTIFFIAPQIPLQNYSTLNIFIRILNIVCLFYICIHCLREHKKEPEPISLWVFYGYAILGVSQLLYLIIYFYLGPPGDLAFWVAVATRLAGLTIFLFASYQTFHQLKKGINK